MRLVGISNRILGLIFFVFLALLFFFFFKKKPVSSKVAVCWSPVWSDVIYADFFTNPQQNEAMILIVWTESIIFISQLVIFGLMLLHWLTALEDLLENLFSEKFLGLLLVSLFLCFTDRLKSFLAFLSFASSSCHLCRCLYGRA